jgi:phosphomannomutase/phosphoglucomutase
MNPRVFREYDIRGVAERDFPDDFVAELGDAIGEHLFENGARRITLARDCRLSSPRIHRVIRARLLAAGLEVLDIGMVHTPGLYFSVFHLAADGGVMITASHNPEEDNGFKIMRGKGTIFGAESPRPWRRARVSTWTFSRPTSNTSSATFTLGRADSRSLSTPATAWAVSPPCPSCAG